MGLVVGVVFGANASLVGAQLTQETGAGLALRFLGSVPPLFGEELVVGVLTVYRATGTRLATILGIAFSA